MAKKINELFVKIDNRNIEGELAVTPLEMKLYCHLYINMTHEINLTTKVAWLVDLIELKSSKQRNKEAIEEAINGLVDKGAIEIEKKADFIVITNFTSYQLADKFTMVPYSFVRGLTDEDELKLYTAIKRFKVADYPASRIANILSCSDNKARKVVKSLREKGLISMIVGPYISGTNQQESNKYSIEISEHYIPAPKVDKPKKDTVMPETKAMVQKQLEAVKKKPEPVQEPVDVTTPPTLQEMIPHVNLEEVKAKLTPEPVKTSVPEFDNNGMFDIEAALAAEGLNFNGK